MGFGCVFLFLQFCELSQFFGIEHRCLLVVVTPLLFVGHLDVFFHLLNLLGCDFELLFRFRKQLAKGLPDIELRI